MIILVFFIYKMVIGTHDTCISIVWSSYSHCAARRVVTVCVQAAGIDKKRVCLHLQCLAVTLHFAHTQKANVWNCLECPLFWGGSGGYSHHPHMPMHAIHSGISEHRPTSTMLLSHLDQEQAEKSQNYLIISF